MIVMGVDPGPKDFSWALYSEEVEDITAWGTVILDPTLYNWEHRKMIEHHVPKPEDLTPDLIAVEKVYSPVGVDFRIRVRHIDATGRMVGIVQMGLGAIYLETPLILVARSTVKAALPGVRMASNDKDVNRVMRGLCPALAHVVKGLNSHTRAAAAVAYVGAGQFQRQKVERRLAE